MTTMLEFATADLARVSQERTAAQSELAAAQTGLQAAQADRDAIAKRLGVIQTDIAAKRAEIAAAATPAAVHAAEAELELLLIELHAEQGKAFDVKMQIDAYLCEIDVKLDTLGRATTRAAHGASAFATAQKVDAEHAGWRAAQAVPPLATISQQAAAALASNVYTRAQTRATAGFQADLLAHVRKRAASEQARLDAIESRLEAMQDDLDEKAKADRGIAGEVAPLETDYARAEAAYRAAITGAQDRLNRAVGLLASIDAAPKLPAADSAKMQDATIVNAARAAPVTNKEALEAAEDELAQAEADLDRARSQAAAGLAETPLTVAAAETARDDAAAAVTAATYTPQQRAKLAAWEVTVPDSSWSLLAAFDEAHAILKDLEANATPAKLTALETTMTTAADALAAKLVDLAESEHDLAVLTERAKLQAELLRTASAGAAARILNALRGDG
jgi:chromosome segregation protein